MENGEVKSLGDMRFSYNDIDKSNKIILASKDSIINKLALG